MVNRVFFFSLSIILCHKQYTFSSLVANSGVQLHIEFDMRVAARGR